MIAVSLTGGLGNQMFQYAAGRSLAARHDTELVLNLWNLDRPDPTATTRSYGLGCFRVDAGLRRRVISRRPLPPDLPVRQLVRGRLRNAVARFRVLEEDRTAFCQEFFSVPDWTLLVGFWQSPAYFADYDSVIRREFTLRAPPTGRARDLLEEIGSTTSVSVHVRRGDYVAHREVSRRVGVLDVDYYRRAINTIAERATNLQLFVFSDDLDWCRRHLRSTWPVRFFEGTPSEDLVLMSACRHHVIANSSFSWWGAWLDPRPDKLVVAPRRWFRDPHWHGLIIPADWSWILV